MKEKNAIEIRGDICHMNLYNRNRELIAVTTFNVWHLDKIKNHKWGISWSRGRNYPYSGLAGYLHKIVLPTKKGFEPDHKDGNSLNNVDRNLRVSTHAQNCANRKKPSNNTSGFKGVVRCNQYWRATARHNGKQFTQYCKTKEEAALAYNKIAKRVFGEFAHLNININ